MTNSFEIQANPSEVDNESSSNLSDSSPPESIKQDNNLNQTSKTLYIDTTKENDLTQFIIQAREQGFNCLDLSKRNISSFPTQLLDFSSLQYLYLEGNQLTQLPLDLFLRLSNLQWIDLRNNRITSLPTTGLAKHKSLRYLLLSGNLIQTLPAELGKVKTLTALNLDGNPIVYPPMEIIKQGIKSIQQYLRGTLDSDDEQPRKSSDDDDKPRQTTGSYLRKSKSEIGFCDTNPPNLLPSHLQSCIQYKRMSYSEMRIRRSPSARPRAQSDMKFTQVKTKPIMNRNNDSIEEQQRLMHLTHRTIKIDDEMQKLNNYQKQGRPRSCMKSGEYQQPIVQAPFRIDTRYIHQMNKDQQDMIRYGNRRSHSSFSFLKDDEERRIQDQQIQDNIRLITNKMLQRRSEARGNIFEERRQAQVELRELQKLDLGGKEPSVQIENHFKSYSGSMKSRKKL